MIAERYLYRVDERLNSGWKPGMCVWMEQRNFRSFLKYIGAPQNRVRREDPNNCNDDPRFWNGKTCEPFNKLS